MIINSSHINIAVAAQRRAEFQREAELSRKAKLAEAVSSESNRSLWSDLKRTVSSLLAVSARFLTPQMSSPRP